MWSLAHSFTKTHRRIKLLLPPPSMLKNSKQSSLPATMLNQNHIFQKEKKADKAKSMPPPPPLPLTSPTIPPSLISSPSHEFSFTISFHHHNHTSAPSQLDFAPADDIFFHGHLLPLNKLQSASNAKINDEYIEPNNIKSKPKLSLLSLLCLTKWLRRNDDEETRRKKKKKKKKKVCFYLFFKWEKSKRPCPFSSKDFGSREGSARWRWLREESIWTSHNNSGLHVVASDVASTSSKESTLVELENAVQAAIEYCKNSIAVKDEKF